MNRTVLAAYTAVAAWMAVIFAFSAQEAEVSQGQSDFFTDMLVSATGGEASAWSFVIRKSAHIVVFFVLGVLAYAAVRLHGWSQWRTVVVAVAIAAGYAMIDELHQVFVPGRSGELRDVMIDTVAASVGVGLCLLLVQWRKTQKRGTL